MLVGTETGDDAGVYLLDDERALVVTTDFITPVCDDPYRFGAIAAANSLSDVFAMGGRPLVALAVAAFPKELAPDMAGAILAGGQDKAAEAGAVVIGGHTVMSEQLFYGLAVTGLVHPRRIMRNYGARPGDVLLLTKPLGTGLLINGRRKGLGSDEDLEAALLSMEMLNRAASEVALTVGAHAATDVTGFGLIGHALGMAEGSRVSFVFDAATLPLFKGALAMAAAEVTTGSTSKNRRLGEGKLRWSAGEATRELEQIFYDPQTSGGLLLAVEEKRADEALKLLQERGCGRAAQIGWVIEEAPTAIEVRGQK